MPLHSIELKVEPQTKEHIAVSKAVNIGSPSISSIRIYMTDNAVPALRWKLSYRGIDFAPEPEGSWGIGPDEWYQGLIMQGPPYEITLSAYNLARDWPHTVWAYIRSGDNGR